MSLKVEHLSFSYGNREILSDVSFTAENGTLTAVMGPNGVGKTTLFRCILGILSKYTGEIRIDEKKTGNMSVKELAHHIAYIPQIHGMVFAFSVEDIVLMGTAHRLSSLSSPGEAEKKAAYEAMEKMKISHLADRNFSKLSGGEQQLVLIARALAQGTKIILMDEPTASLDYGNQSMVLAQAHTLARKGYTILLSTHNPQHALWYADQALAIQDGCVCALGSPEDVLNKNLIFKLYEIDTEFISTHQGTVIVPEKGGRG